MSNPKSKIQNPKWFGFPLRLLVYLILIGLALVVEVRLVLRFGFQRILLENTVVEWVSVGLCLLSALAFAAVSAADRTRRGICLILAILAAAACVREMDVFLASCLTETTYHVLLTITPLSALILAAIWRGPILREVKALLERPAFVLLLFGFTMIVFWAQVLGQRKLWGYFTTVYGPIDANGVKCMVEESFEMIGYFLIFFGAIEELIIKPSAEVSE